jgi:hypothetical protein
MTISTVDPFEPHPETEPQEKKINNTLTLQQISSTIKKMMVSIRTESSPHARYDKHYVTAVLTGLLIELEEKCQNN